MKLSIKSTIIIFLLSFTCQAYDISYSDLYIYDNQDYDTNTNIENSISISDPLEPVNKTIFGFNNIVDLLFIMPVAEFYTQVVPDVGKSCIGNFAKNISEPLNFINLVLQGKFATAQTTFGRFLTNTILGFFGIVDVASGFNMPYSGQDFGQTLAYHGFPSGPYLVIPVFGPSTLRDTTGKVGDFFLDPMKYKLKKNTYNAINLVWLLHKRAASGGVISNVRQSLDPYDTAKQLYIQNRSSKINN